jgi:lysozyme
MATYGSGQMLGSGINPESFKQDYSGFTRAAEMQAQGIASLGQNISGAIEGYEEAKKEQKKVREERKKIDAETKAGRAGIESAIKLGDSLGFDVKGMLSPVLDRMDDPNTTPMEAAALGREASSQIANILNLGFKAQDQKTQQANLMQDAAYKNAQLDIAQQNANSRARSAIAAGGAPPQTIDIPLGDGSTRKMQWSIEDNSYVPIKVSGLDGTSNLVDLVKRFEGFNPNAYSDYKQTSIGYGTKGRQGEVLNEEQATERLKTELLESARRIKEAASLRGVSLNQNQFNAITSFDYNTGKGADLIQRFADKPNELAAKMKEYTKAGGEDLPGLVKRRAIEAALFMTPSESSVGVTPAKAETVETFRPATAKDSAPYGGIPGQISSTGKFYPINPSGIKQKQEARNEVRNLYFSGDKIGALDLLNAAGGKGLLGGDYTIADLDELYKDEVKPPANDTRVPLDQVPTTR